MPFLTTLKFPDNDQQRYDDLGARLASNGPPRGILFHSCAAVSGGWGIVDIWESASAFDTFIDQTLLPAMRSQGWAGRRHYDASVSPLTTRGLFSVDRAAAGLKKSQWQCRFKEPGIDQ